MIARRADMTEWGYRCCGMAAGYVVAARSGG